LLLRAASLAVCTAFLCVSAQAEPPRRLNDAPIICDAERAFCLRGSLWYRPNSRRLELRGRINQAPGPGWVSIVFRGSSRTNQPASAIMEFPVRGAYSEIVDRSFIPDHPQVGEWRVERLFFEPDGNAAQAARDRH
jgi:hypothetical protein